MSQMEWEQEPTFMTARGMFFRSFTLRLSANWNMALENGASFEPGS